jgi:dTDP-glucose pyrophosphorylase
MRRLLLIPAAGRSNRMGGLPKELLPVRSRPGRDGAGPTPVPILRHVLDCGLAAGADRVVVVTSSAKATALMEAVNSFALGVPVSYVHQAEPDGLGAAVLCARAEVRDHDVTLMLMPDALIRPPESVARAVALVAGGATVGVTLHRVERPQHFGVAVAQGRRVLGFVDKPGAPCGQWVWTSVAFSARFLPLLERTQPAAGEWGLTEALDAAAAASALEAEFVADGAYYDVGTFDGYLAALAQREADGTEHAGRAS